MADLGPISSVALMPLALAAPNVPVGNRGKALSSVSPPEAAGDTVVTPAALYLENGRLLSGETYPPGTRWVALLPDTSFLGDGADVLVLE